MNPEVKLAEALPNYKLKIKFTNKEIKIFDIFPLLDIGIFSKFKNKEYFSQVRVAFGAIEWPNEQDFSKDTLYILKTSLAA